MWLFASTVSSICSQDKNVSLTPLGNDDEDNDDDDDGDNDDDDDDEDLILGLWNNRPSSDRLPLGNLHQEFQVVLWSLGCRNNNDYN